MKMCEWQSVGELLDISMLDHIVVGRNCWVSMKERGLGFRQLENG